MNPELTIMLLRLAEETEETERSLFSASELGGYACTALIALINVLVAYWFIKRFVFKPIMGAMKKREDMIRNNMDEAAKSNEEAKANAEASKQEIEKARIEASEILETSRENAEKQAEIITGKANDDASEIISRAEADAKRIKKVALEEMKDEISDLAVTISTKILGDVVEEEKLKLLSQKHTEAVLEEEVNKLG